MAFGIRSAPVRILLAQHDPSRADAFVAACRANAFDTEIVVVRDGDEAIAYIDGAGQISEIMRPDMMVLDTALPKVSGVEVMERLRSDSRWISLPVLMFSAPGDTALVQRCYELGVQACVIRPPSAELMSDLVETLTHLWSEYLIAPPEPAKSGLSTLARVRRA